MLTFSQGLIFFSVTLTLVFLILLVLSQRVKRSQSEGAFHPKKLDAAIFVLLLTESLTIILLQIPSFKSSFVYLISLPLIAGILMCTLRWSSSINRNRQYLILLSAILFHIAILYSPPVDIDIAERTSSMASLTLQGHWDSNWHFLNPTYNPFPMDVSLFSTLSMITNIPYISQVIDWVLYLPLIVAFDLILYSLTKRVTSSTVAGTLSIFILASLPTANLLLHASKWTGNLLVLIFTLALIKASQKSIPYAFLIIANLSYTAAIFFHPSAAIGAFLPVGIIAISYVGPRIIKSETWSKVLRNRLFLSAALLLVIITLTRAIYTAGYSEVIFPALRNFATGIFSTPSEELSPVYEFAVNPLNAYAWTIPIALASALAIYAVLKKKAVGGIFTLIMYSVGAFFALVGLVSAVFTSGGFQGATYPAFVFFVPAAAIVGAKVLQSSKVLAAVFLILMVLFTGIAITDPMMSPERYRLIGAGNVAPKAEDYTEAHFLTDALPSNIALLCPYEISTLFSYLTTAEGKPTHKYYVSSADFQRIEVKRVVQDKQLQPSVTYIWPTRWQQDIKSQLTDVPINIFYDSRRYVIFDEP